MASIKASKTTYKYDYKFPKPTRFLESYIGSNLAISQTKISRSIYNIKAPNFRQDMGYIIFFNSEHELKNRQLFYLITSLITSKKLRNYICYFVQTDVFLTHYRSQPAIYYSKEISSTTSLLVPPTRYPRFSEDKIKEDYLSILLAEGYKLSFPNSTRLTSTITRLSLYKNSTNYKTSKEQIKKNYTRKLEKKEIRK